MFVRALSLLFLLAAAICAAELAEPTTPYPVINLCKDCRGRRVSRDQVCLLENATELYQPCRCDADCITYGDCCPSTHHTCLDSSAKIGEESAPFQCQEIFLGHRDRGSRIPPLGHHYWMVSSCSNRWLEEMGNSEEIQEIVSNCINHLDNDGFPPVTDLRSGLVYRNEHCARCNNVSNSANWDFGFVCDSELIDLLSNPGDYIITEEVFNQFCKIDKYVEPPSLPSSLPPARLCYPQIDSCLELDTLNGIIAAPWNSTYYHSVVDLCREGHFQNHVVLKKEFNDTIPFRNEYCALCNGVDIADIGCFAPPNFESSAGIGIAPTPFNVILDVFGKGRVATASHTTASSIDVSCSEATEVYDPVIGQCHPTVSTPDDKNSSNASCSEKLIALTDPTAFEYVSTDTLLYNEELYIVEFNTSNGTPIICVNFSTNGTIVSTINFLTFSYPVEYSILTYIGCPLSVIGCILILLTYSLFKELRTLPSRILMHLAVAILTGNLLILVGGPLGENVKIFCTPIAILDHYVFLSQFSWMSLMSTEIARNLYQAFKMKAHDPRAHQVKLLVVYSLLGWGIPLLIVLLAIIVNFTTTGLVLYGEKEDGTPGLCWINHFLSVVVAFVVPLGIMLIYNAVIFVIATVYLCASSISHSKINNNKKAPFLRLNVAIFSVSGVTWLFGFIALLPRLEWAWIPYAILNSAQGLIIFVAFLCTKRVALLYLNLITRQWRKDRITELESSTKETMSSTKGSKHSSEEHLAV